MSFHKFTLAEIHNETPELLHLSLQEPGPEFRAAYTVPGQYIQIRHGDLKPGFFALASGPKHKDVDLLIKRGSPLTNIIAEMRAGDAVEATVPQGKGYPLAQAKGRDVFLVGVGSGIAPLRALMHELLRERSAYGRIVFVYGARASNAFPYAAEVQSWKSQNVDVTCACSQPAAGTWSGPVGRVQACLAAREKVDAQSAVFVCGMKPMVEDVKTAFTKLGLADGRIFQNF
jgi:sulfhydrogenase subunit gamma (sulfur reductase)